MNKNITFLSALIAGLISYCSASKVLVTGGAGFIGSHTAQALLDRGDEVVILDHNKSSHLRGKYDNEPRAKFYQADICDKESLKKIFEIEHPDIICHLAAQLGGRENDVFIRVNILGTLNLLEMARDFKAQHFILGSSASVYGFSQEPPFREDKPADKPVTVYGASKRSAELLAYTYHSLYGIPTSIVRIFSTYGPRGINEVSRFVDAIYHGRPIRLHRSGRYSLHAMRGLTHVSDIVDGIVRAIDRPHEFEIYNLGSTQWATNKDLITIIEEVVQKKARIQVVDAKPVFVPISYPDIRKAQAMLGFDIKVFLKDGVKKFYEWYLENQVK